MTPAHITPKQGDTNMTKKSAAMNKTDKARILDMDGNCLAIFPGYAWPGLAAVMAHYPSAFKVRIINRSGFTRATLSLVAS
jgi:hypothetical protein